MAMCRPLRCSPCGYVCACPLPAASVDGGSLNSALTSIHGISVISSGAGMSFGEELPDVSTGEVGSVSDSTDTNGPWCVISGWPLSGYPLPAQLLPTVYSASSGTLNL